MQAAVVRRVFAEFCAGAGFSRIASDLNRDGIAAMGGGTWFPLTVRRVLLNETYTGDIGWSDYQVSVDARPINGDAHLLLGRAQGALRSYALALLPGRLALLRNDHGYTEAASTPFAWKHGESIRLTLRVRGGALEGSASREGDAAPASLAWTDPQPYLTGMIGLANQRACRTEFRRLRVTP